MSGLVAKTVAAARSAQARVRIGFPFNVGGRPAAPIQRSREIGWSMTPRIGRPCRARAISVPNSGTPLIKDLVPSIGSSTQTNSASSRSRPNSSPMMPWSGKRAAINCRIAVSAARSAAVTGDRSALSSTRIAWRKYGRIAAPAASASSAASAKAASSGTPAAAAVAATLLLFERLEIGDHVGPVLDLRQAGEAHLGALGEILRLVEPDIELVRVPLLALMRRQGLRELVARHIGDVLVHHAKQVGADLVRAALVEAVA